MDRSKQAVKRGPKVKTLPPSGDFIVLGSKASKPASDILEIKLGPSTKAGSSGDRKRDSASSSSGSASIGGTLSKKSKTSSSSSRDDDRKDRARSLSWDSIAIEVDAHTLVSQVTSAEDGGDDERIEKLLCGSVKLLRNSRSKLEPALFLSLLFMAKTRPNLFCSNLVTEAFSSLLKREVVPSFKAKGNAATSVLAVNILLAAYHDEEKWPDTFVKVYLDDALGERVWVDHDDCKGFVDNVLTAFSTKLPPKGFLPPELTFKPDVAASSPTSNLDQDDETAEIGSHVEGKYGTMEVSVSPRYLHSTESVEQFVLEVVRDQVNRRQPMDNISRNVLRVLVATCGIGEVRLLVSQKLEMWLQNPKLTRQAQELLLVVCLNCGQHHQLDVDVIGNLIKIRLKTKPLVNHYLLCIRELLGQHTENLNTVLKHTIYNELSNSRNPNNMGLLGVIFQHSPEQAARVLAEVFQDVLNNRDDYLRAVRGLFREIVRTLRHDLNFSAFCLGLMTERKEQHFKDMDATIRERIFLSIADLITLSIFLSITPAVKEVALSRGERRDVSVLRNYQRQAAEIERDAIWWLHNVVLNTYKPGKTEFVHCLQKVLFMEQPEHYYNKDNWPQESERMILLRLASDVPLLEDTLLWVLLIGLSKDHPLNASEALELVDQLVKRVALLHSEDFLVLEVQRIDLINIVFNLCAYHHPENISLPQGYQHPSLAIASLYWKAWILLLIVTAHNPLSFGFVVWETYPTLRCFMEMCITNHFSFPPPTMAFGDKADEIKSKELQICQLEKQEILEFENHLASASTKKVITETNSLLLSQLTTMDPSGFCRRPPNHVLEQLKTLNHSLKLGHLLCRTRNPDFLLDIIQRQGASQSMPWLANLVESSEGTFDHLPIQCLCEFLLTEQFDLSAAASNIDKDDGKEETKAEKVEKVRRKEKLRKQQSLLKHLQEVLYNPSPHPQQTLEVLDYFLRRLGSSQSTARQQALHGLSLVLSLPIKSDEDDDEDVASEEPQEVDKNAWLLRHLPTLPHFEMVRYQTALAVRQACQVENNPVTMSGYIHFLADYAPDDLLQDLADLALDVAHLIVQRTTVINYLLPFGAQSSSDSSLLLAFLVIFVKYLRKAREPSKEAYSWSESQDQILLQWSTGEAATMHVLVVHAMIVLLTYGPPTESSLFNELLEVWFPADVDPPQAFLVDTSEEALLYPDWLKLRMIRSSVELLVNAALKDLEPAQLVLFIQSFGIPIQSVSKLLRALDMAVEYDSYNVESVVVDKVYMAQLVEVQQQRGAKHGQQFASFLGLMSVDPVVSEDGAGVVVQSESKAVSVIRQTSPPVTGRHLKPQPMASISEHEVSSKLAVLFGLESFQPVVGLAERRAILRTLQKFLTLEARQQQLDRPFSRQVVHFFASRVDSSEGPMLLNALLNQHTYSCPLFRLLVDCGTSSVISSPLTSMLLVLSEKIVSYWQTSKLPPSPLIQLIQAAMGSRLPDVQKKEPLLDDLSHDSVIKIVRDVSVNNPSLMEQVIESLIRKAINCCKTDSLVSAFTSILIGDLSESSAEMNLKETVSHSLLVDWLELMEPEVIETAPHLQQQLLFRRCQNAQGFGGGRAIYKTSRLYLLATLTHQANWDTLKGCISLLLSEDLHKLHKSDLKTKYDPSTVLDFLWACIYIPKIWQGRDKHIPKHSVEDDVLQLSNFQVLAVACYIMSEAASETNVEKVWSNFECRMSLLLRCCGNDSPRIECLVRYLVEIVDSSCSVSILAHRLLMHTYLQIPYMIKYVENKEWMFENVSLTINTTSKLDPMSHTLLTALSANWECTRDGKEKFQDAEIACRKLTATHPILVLRQLSMMATALRGRVHLEFPIMITRHHVAFFSCILGLLQLMHPYVFKTEYGMSLQCVCDSYFSLVKTHGLQNRELASLIEQFLAFLLQYMQLDTQRALRYVQKHGTVLGDLSNVYSDLPSLRSILSVTSLPRQPTQHRAEEGAAAGSVALDSKDLMPTFLLSFAPPQLPPSWTSTQLAPIITRLLDVDCVEDVSSALHDLDGLSSHKVAILEHLTHELKRLLSHPNEGCRTLAHNLVLRWLKYRPRASHEFLDAFLSCFESDRSEVMTSALERLAEFVLLCQEHTSLLLQRAFHVHITTNINAMPYISDVIMLLSLQGGN